jgi:WD40 repeat protein
VRGLTGSLSDTELSERFRLTGLDYVSAIAVSPSGDHVALGLGDGTVVLLEAERGIQRWRAVAHREGVLGLEFSPDGNKLASCGQDTRACIWSLQGELLTELPGESSWVELVRWSPRGDRIATASGKKIRIWSKAGAPLVETEPLPSTVTDLAWRTDGSALAACAYGGVHLWTVAAHAKARHLPFKGSLVSLAWSPDMKVIACGSQDCSVRFWRLSTGRDSEMRGYPFKPRALAWDATSSLLATSGDSSATLWDFRGKGPEGSAPVRLASHAGIVTTLQFHPRRDLLASGSQDTSVIVWEPRKSDRPVKIGWLEDEITALAWFPRTSALVAADSEGNVVAWDVQGGSRSK